MVGKILFQLNVYIYIPWKYQGYQSWILSMVGCNFAEGLSDAFAAQLSFKVVFFGDIRGIQKIVADWWFP